MKYRFSIALLVIVVGAAGCSLPSVSWFGSSTPVDPSAEALFEEGMRAFNDKKYVRALDNFSKLRTDHPFSPLITQVELKMADAYYLNQQYPEAITAFKEFQSMHPTNENMPFVTLRLGQAHFDQFTATDREQKNTEIAKGYFETVVTNYPKSPEAVEAKEKLAKVLEYLAEHEFNIAYFYFQQEKFPAARDRFEDIIRKYKATPTAVKSLFYLGESYRNEKNGVRAALAYEALIQHYPQSKYAAEAKTQLAVVEKEKRDPLELVLMRDRRPGAVTPEAKEDAALAKVRDLNLVAKKEVVQEEPGDDKGFFRRVADKINPFSSSESDKKEEAKEAKKPAGALEVLTRRAEAQKKEKESGGFLSSLWPFGGKDTNESAKSSEIKTAGVVSQIDQSLDQKGIDAAARQAALKTPAADLPKVEAPPPPAVDTAALLGSIDANLKKSGMNAAELPPPPEAAAAFRDPAVAQAIIAKAGQPSSPVQGQDLQNSNILSSIDQKLKAQGVDAGKFDKPPTAEEIKAAAAQKPKSVELEPKLVREKGPLFLSPSEVQQRDITGTDQEPSKSDSKTDSKVENPESVKELPNRVLVKGPVQTQPSLTTARPAERKPSASQDEEPKGVIDQMRQDMDNIGKALNPFRW